jgi:hypothetical protein
MSEISFFLIIVLILVVVISFLAKKILKRSLWNIMWDWILAFFS